MHRFFVAKKLTPKMVITGLDAHHIKDVLRMGKGDLVQLTADDGRTAVAEIVAVETGKIWLQCQKVLTKSNEPTVRLNLVQGLAKGEKMDLVVQKAVELGVSKIYPAAMDHSVVRLDKDQALKKERRWQKIAETAAKQCKRDLIPRVEPVRTLMQILAADDSQLKLVAYESEERVSLRQVLAENPGVASILVVIGPEGGLAEAEVEAAVQTGAVTVSLGPRILRTETAGMVVLTAVLFATGNLDL